MFTIEIGDTPLNPIPDSYLPSSAKPRWFLLPKGKCQGQKLFFYDLLCGHDSPEATLLFVHGNPESSFTFRRIVDRIIDHNSRSIRIIALDHIGFGLSDIAKFEMVDIHHAENLSLLVDALDLNDVTLVIHDWGGPIGIGAFLGKAERVSGLALMNTTVFPMPKTGHVYPAFPVPIVLGWTWLGHIVPDGLWQWIPPLVLFSPGNRKDFVFRHIPNFLWRAITGHLTEEEKIYKEMFRPKANARASRRHVKQTGVWGYGYHYHDPTYGAQSNHEFYHKIQTKLIPSWSKNSIVVVAFFGTWDPCGKPEVQLQWLEALPQLSGLIHQFPDIGHFVQEHKPDEIAKAMLEMKDLK